MKKTWIFLGSIVLVLALLGAYIGTIYNGLVTAEEIVNRQWAQVEGQYQRRYDLIPNLVSAVKGVLKQEQQVFGDIAAARTHYASAASPEQKVDAADQLESSLARLLVIVENYPELKSSETVQTLMSQFEGTENRISVERQRYNETVQDFNTSFRRFPRSMISAILGFKEKDYFTATSSAQTAPQVDLNLK